MSTVEVFLRKLDMTRSTAPGRWVARCPAHDDNHPSLSIRERDDGVVLVHCFGGCGVDEVLGAVGMNAADLFPKTSTYEPGKRHQGKSWSAADILRGVTFELNLVSIVAYDLAKGKILSDTDKQRLEVAAKRIRAAADFYG